ncbi:MAG: deoxyuridine 5'-triphosphate nucleotidohydrolase [Candidatus Altiarchaeota archaeon]|nr:deoxyuridine 5'-triphosphate nucleotidohydrolase [Candidatus Altiarchaeota archaeon]
MFIPGNEVAKNLEGVNEEQIQPAGVDLTVDAIWEMDSSGELDFSNKSRKIPKGRELDFESPIHLNPGGYLVRYGEKISIPKDCVGMVLPRSSLMRMGATLVSALWDPGYTGRGKGLLIITNPHGIDLHPNARIGQMTFFRGDAKGTYEGSYQNEE